MVAIGLFGKHSCGKTTFLATIYKTLSEPVILKNRVYEHIQDSNNQYLDENLKFLLKNEFPPASAGYHLQKITFSSQGGGNKQVSFSINDVSGTDLVRLVKRVGILDKDDLMNPGVIKDDFSSGIIKVVEQLKGLILMVDPDISSTREAWQQDLLLWRILQLVKIYHLKRLGKSMKLPIAIVISKLDRFKLSKGEKDFENDTVKNWCTGTSGVPRTATFLKELVPIHSYFGVSSVSKTKFKKKSEYPVDLSPVNVLKPITWLLENII